MDNVPLYGSLGLPLFNDASGLFEHAECPLWPEPPLLHLFPPNCILCRVLGGPESLAPSFPNINLTEREIHSEVYQKLSCPTHLQPAPAEKEVSTMSEHTHTVVNSAPRTINRPPELRHEELRNDTVALKDATVNQTHQIAHLRQEIQQQAQAHKAKLEMMEAAIHTKDQQIQSLNDRILDMTYAAMRSQQKYLTPTVAPKATVPEPRTMPTTYIRPKRAQPTRIENFLSGVPFWLFLMGLALAMVLSITMAYPTPTIVASFLELVGQLFPIMFIIGVFSLCMSVVLDARR
ncbi:MAG: hypothetical protein HC800_20715 [Phormidesmis sp. RL_2_1]|nr:hypothetical protein [Phormidesmis sp. RL_2_1]